MRVYVCICVYTHVGGCRGGIEVFSFKGGV